MSVYNRKGGSGKGGTLRQQFNYYKRQLRDRLIKEQAFKEARGVGTIEGRIKSLFKHLDYEEVFNKGITRKVGNRTIRFVGSDAVNIQIKSMRERASKSYQTDNFITNYIVGMEKTGFDYETINKVEKILNSTSVDRLTYLIDSGLLPSIQFIYAGIKTEEEFLQDVVDAVRTGVSKEELDILRYKQKELVKVIKEKSDILGW